MDDSKTVRTKGLYYPQVKHTIQCVEYHKTKSEDPKFLLYSTNYMRDWSNK